MKTLFIITTPHNGYLYVLFYSAAFLIAAGIFIYQGLRNRYPQRTWLVITLFAIMCSVIGNKAITIDYSHWVEFLRGGSLPDTGRSVLGCILGLILGVFISQRWLRFNKPVIDHLAYALPLGMAITRLGCLFGGCCYGTPTHLPWGVQYGPASRAFHSHVESSFISSTNALSLTVHPTQMYDLLFCLLILYIVWLTRKYWKAPGSRFLFSVILYTCFRFAIEFIRQSPGAYFISETILGIKVIQWLLLGAVAIMASILVLRERKQIKQNGHIDDIHPVSLTREFVLFATVPVLLALTFDWLDHFERLVILIFMVPLFLVFVHSFYSRLSVPELRWKMPVILLVAGLSMSQVSLDRQAGPATEKYRGWFSIDAFGGLGNYPEKIFDCEGNVTDIVKRDYSTWGAGLTYHYKPGELQHLKSSFNLFSSVDRSDAPNDFDYSTPALNALVSYEMKYFGATLGMNLFFDEYWISDIVPVGDLWVGRKDIIFAETRFMTDFHLLGPPGVFQVGVGSGFGQFDKSMGRAGVSMMPSINLWGDKLYVLGAYIGGDILVKNKATIRTNLFFGDHFGGSLGIQVHLGKNRWTSRVKKLRPAKKPA